MGNRVKAMIRVTCTVCCILLLMGCSKKDPAESRVEVPRGYTQELEIETDGRRVKFGPFVGYYFKPVTPRDLTRIDFICFNENNFYTLDLPENTRIFEGDGVLTLLPDNGTPLPSGKRITPVFFSNAPEIWQDSRPEPKEAYVHFHSGYDRRGAARLGYWLRHRALARFTYDMGGRVTPDSVLYHQAAPGIDTGFARIIEFDQGPGLDPRE